MEAWWRDIIGISLTSFRTGNSIDRRSLGRGTMKFSAWAAILIPVALGMTAEGAAAQSQCMQTFPPCGTVLPSHFDDPYRGKGKVEWYREDTLRAMNALLQQQTDMSPLARSMMDTLRSQALAGKSGAGTAGRTVAGLLGIGNCTRHFYNNSSDFFAVALWNAGTCGGGRRQSRRQYMPYCAAHHGNAQLLEHRQRGS